MYKILVHETGPWRPLNGECRQKAQFTQVKVNINLCSQFSPQAELCWPGECALSVALFLFDLGPYFWAFPTQKMQTLNFQTNPLRESREGNESRQGSEVTSYALNK